MRPSEIVWRNNDYDVSLFMVTEYFKSEKKGYIARQDAARCISFYYYI